MVDKNNSPSAFRCRTHVGLIRWRTCGGFVHQLRRRPPRSPGTRCGRALHPFGRWRWRNAGSLGLTGSYYPRRQNDQAAWRPESSCIHHDYRVEVLTEKKKCFFSHVVPGVPCSKSQMGDSSWVVWRAQKVTEVFQVSWFVLCVFCPIPVPSYLNHNHPVYTSDVSLLQNDCQTCLA